MSAFHCALIAPSWRMAVRLPRTMNDATRTGNLQLGVGVLRSFPMIHRGRVAIVARTADTFRKIDVDQTVGSCVVADVIDRDRVLGLSVVVPFAWIDEMDERNRRRVTSVIRHSVPVHAVAAIQVAVCWDRFHYGVVRSHG